MGVADDFKKWTNSAGLGVQPLINEHGSVVILKERIALVNDKFVTIEAENKIIRSENDALRLDNGKLQEQWLALKKQLSEIHSIDPVVGKVT